MYNDRACLFDLDGVLVDTAKSHFIAWRKLANSLGADFTEKDNEDLKGISRIESLRRILDWASIRVDESEIRHLAEQKNLWYLDLIGEMTCGDLLPGSLDLLTSLKSNNIKIALGSASRNASLILEKLEIVHFFDVVIDGNKIKQSKPNPEVFLRGANALKVLPTNCIVIEDAISGIRAAKCAGMKSIGIGHPEVLCEADRVFPDLSKVNMNEIQKLWN